MSFNFNHNYNTKIDTIQTVDFETGEMYNQGKEVYLDALKKEQSRYKPSIYTEFKPVACIVYYSVFGWTSQYVAKFYADLKDYEADQKRIFTDEPSGKFGKKRTEFLITKW